MSRNRGNSERAGGIYDEWKNMGFKNNPANNWQRLIENMYIRVLTDLAASRFKWSGMPPEIDIRFLELTLFYQALSVFYKDGRYNKYMALRANTNGWLDYQNNPTGYNVIGTNFNNIGVSAIQDTKYDLQSEDGIDLGEVDMGMAIPIWANKQRMPDIDIVLVYARKLAKLDRSVEINSDNARLSKVVVSSEAQQLTMANISRQIEEGQNNIKVTGQFNAQDINVLDMGVDPVTILNLDIVRDRQWNKCMTLLGIDSANQDKKERLVSDEVNANDDQTSTMRFVNLNERRAAAARINEHYPDLHITVDYYTAEERKELAEQNNSEMKKDTEDE